MSPVEISVVDISPFDETLTLPSMHPKIYVVHDANQYEAVVILMFMTMNSSQGFDYCHQQEPEKDGSEGICFCNN